MGAVLRPLLFLVVSFLVARLLVSLVGSVDWQQVATALGQLDWAQAPALLALLLARQAFNSVPLAVFVPGLGFWRGFQNDLTANLVGTVAPPPGDIVVRVSMFRFLGHHAGRRHARGDAEQPRVLRHPLQHPHPRRPGCSSVRTCRERRSGRPCSRWWSLPRSSWL